MLMGVHWMLAGQIVPNLEHYFGRNFISDVLERGHYACGHVGKKSFGLPEDSVALFGLQMEDV